MEKYIDSFSKRLATAVSRREMLSIASRAVLGAFVASTGIGRVWAAATTPPAGVNTSPCGALQSIVQTLVGNKTLSQTKQVYVATVLTYLHAATQGDLVDATCSSCISSQFKDLTPIANQTSCGTVVTPTQSCNTVGASRQQMYAASTLALSAAPTAWVDGDQWISFVELTDELLNCVVDGNDTEARSAAALLDDRIQSGAGAAVLAGTPYCGTVGANFCGPGNSFDDTSVAPYLPSVTTCLNHGCFAHDNCYSSNCVDQLLCYFTEQSAACDAPLLAICNSNCAAESVTNARVCAAVHCLTGSTGYPALDAICSVQYADRSSLSQCQSAVSPCTTPSCGSKSPCGGICCPCGQTCAACASGPSCVTAPCLASSSQCPPGLTECGAICMSAYQTCTPTGPVTPSACQHGSCAKGQPCCTNFLGMPGCGPEGYHCCPTTGNACPPGTTCCDVITSATSAFEPCCTAGTTCFRSGTSSGCCSSGESFCPSPGGAGWCCPPDYACSATYLTCCSTQTGECTSI